MNALFAEHALLPNGWARNVRLAWNAAGVFTEITPNAGPEPPLEQAAGPVFPGMPNVHSHAFQRGDVGPDRATGCGREQLLELAPAHVRFRTAPRATRSWRRSPPSLYVEMLKCGYTSVCEFHYIHHDPHGRPYASRMELSERLVAAAGKAGIGLTLLPVLYEHSGFGKQPPLPEQRRFIASPEAVLEMLGELRRTHPEHGRLRYGVAPHSLRAVSAESLTRLVEGGLERIMLPLSTSISPSRPPRSKTAAPRWARAP